MKTHYFHRSRPKKIGKKIMATLCIVSALVLLCCLSNVPEGHAQRLDLHTWWIVASLWPASIGLLLLGYTAFSTNTEVVTFLHKVSLLSFIVFAIMLVTAAFKY